MKLLRSVLMICSGVRMDAGRRVVCEGPSAGCHGGL